MVDRGPLLTSAIIFYLSIGAAIFQVLEEPNWKKATKDFDESKSKILDKYTCLTLKDLEEILESVSSAAGQGVTITGNATFNNWNWANAVIFAATVITTIGYGNIAPKTSAGRLFCIFYGLFGVPLCLTWISALGKFFAGRAKRLGQFLTRRGVTLRKAQITCTAIFIIWGVLVHLVIPPFIFMSTEDWNYIEGLYFSFITISTIGFGDYVAGVNPKKDYSVLYRYFVEIWIYLGLAWLSLFINWKVSMFVEVHKAIKKRRKKRKESFDYDPRTKKNKQIPMAIPKDVNIPGFLSKKEETYNDLIKQIGLKKNVGKILTGELQDNVPNKDKEVMVMYNKRNSFGYDAVTFTNGFHRDNGLRSMPDREATIFINQLDRISEEEGEPWESKDYKPLIFQNANITFVNEEEECDLSEDDEKSKSSIDENNANSETPNRLDDEFTCLDEASFSSNDMEVSVPYELLNDYHKLDIEASVPYEPLLNDHHKIDNNGDIEASVPYEQLLNDHHKIDNNGDMEASVNYAQLLNDHHKVDASVSYEQLLNDHHKMDASVSYEQLLNDHHKMDASVSYEQLLNDHHKMDASVSYEQLLNDHHKMDASVSYEQLLNDHHKMDASVSYEQLLNDHHKMDASVSYEQLLNDHHKMDASVSYEQLLNDHHKMDNKGDMEASVPHEPLLSNDIEASFQYTQVLNDFHKIFNKGDT